MRLHRTCNTLMLDGFITIICDDDLTPLIIEGAPAQDELYDAWLAVYSEYIDLSANADTKRMHGLLLAIFKLKWKLHRIELCLNYLHLANEVDEDVVAILRKMNFRYAYDRSNLAHFERDLKLIQSRSQQWVIELQMLEAEYEAHNKKAEGDVPDRIYFTNWIIALGREYYPIDPAKTSVLTFAVMMGQLTEKAKDAQK